MKDLWPALRKAIEFLGKVQFTMILLIGGAVIMTAGTIIESKTSREVAQNTIYGTHWFDFFLFLIALNLVVAVINRIPIQRHQWAFVLTHFSIVLLLVGSWISHTFGFEGRMRIYEGSESNRIFMQEKQITVFWNAEPNQPAAANAASTIESAAFPVKGGIGRSGKELQAEDGKRPALRIVAHLPRGVASVELGEGNSNAPAGVQFTLSGEREYSNDWLIAGDQRFERKDLGAVEVELLRIEGQEQWEERLAAKKASAGFRLIVTAEKDTAPQAIPIPEQPGAQFEIRPGVTATIEQFFLHARIESNKIVEAPESSVNPAAVVLIQAGEKSERHILFANFPNFDAMHGRTQEDPLVPNLRLEGSRSIEKPLASILSGPDPTPFLQVTTPAGREQATPIGVGQTETLTSLGLRFELVKYLDHARLEQSVRPAPEGWEGPGGDFLQIELERGGEKKTFWLTYGDTDLRYLGGTPIKVLYGDEIREVPFSIALTDFQLTYHPGSSRPSEYQSTITVKPNQPSAKPRNTVISMNRPLDEQGFRLFQSSYQLGQGKQPDATILSVSRDPGVKVVYTSFVLLVLGIAWYVRNQAQKAHLVARAAEQAKLAEDSSTKQMEA